jgi:hypothetical protein
VVDLARILLSIPASIAFIERYWSICGFTSQKYYNINEDLYEMRCFLRKSYFNLVNYSGGKTTQFYVKLRNIT